MRFEMDDVARMQIEWACTRASAAFAYHVDHRDFQAAAALFTEDGVFDRGGDVMTGRAEIERVISQRPLLQITRHLCANTHFLEVDAEHVTSIDYFTLYRFEGADGSLPVRVANLVPLAIAEYRNELVRTKSGWLFRLRIGRPIIAQKIST
jgi:SnoaL-like domain